jgi:flagellar motor switch protein FliM
MKNVDSQNLFGLFSRMRSMVPPEAPSPACQDVVWTEPHHYGAEAKETLNGIGRKTAACLEKTLQYYCDEAFTVRLERLSEHFASFLAAEVKQSKKNWFFMPLVLADKSHAGFLELSFESAGCLIAQMLRDPEAQIGQSGEISALEQSLLLDILLALADSLIDELAMSQIRLVKTDQLVFGDWPMRFRELQDMTRFSFNAECGPLHLSIAVCLRDETVDPAVGLAATPCSAEEIKKYPERVIGRMQEAPMQVSAQLSSATMSLNDILSLETGDVIILERKIESPIDVLVNGQMCFRAWPARHNGRAAVQVTGPGEDR